MLGKCKKNFLEKETKRLVSSMTHDDIDRTAREFFGERPYKLGDSKQKKIEKIKERLSA